VFNFGSPSLTVIDIKTAEIKKKMNTIFADVLVTPYRARVRVISFEPVIIPH
jgi:hypothetical protein